MSIKFNVPGKKRKELAQEIAGWLGTAAAYAGAPSFAYRIGDQVLDRDGNLSFAGLSDETIERLLQHLYDAGFEFENPGSKTEEAVPEADGCLSIQMPLASFTEGALQNLHDLIDSKSSLIKKALGIDALPIKQTDDWLEFPWFSADVTPDEAQTYIHFVTALCEMAKNQKRINAKEKEVGNEKYAFRCFLLRLGFIGAEYKVERKILLHRLEGSSAFKCAAKGGAEQ